MCGKKRSMVASRKKYEATFWLALEVIIINNNYI